MPGGIGVGVSGVARKLFPPSVGDMSFPLRPVDAV